MRTCKMVIGLMLTSLFTAQIDADNYKIVWTDIIDNGDIDIARGVAVDAECNIILTGYLNNGLDYDYYTVKYNSAGDTIWTRRVNKGTVEQACGVAVDGAGNIIVTGLSHNGSNNDYYTVKYDPNGNVLWTDSVDRGDQDEAYGVAVDKEGNIIVVGRSYSSTSNYDFYIIKYTTTGDTSWTRVLDKGGEDGAYGVVTDTNNNIIVTGYATFGTQDFYIVKYDPNGNILWTDSIDNGDVDYAFGVAVDSENNIIVVGASYIGTGFDWYVVKYNSLGEVIWSDTIGGSGDDEAQAVAVDKENNIIITGWLDYDYYTVKYDPTGNIVWQDTIDNGNQDCAYGVAVDNQNNIIVTGYANNGTNSDYFTVKYILLYPPRFSWVTPVSALAGTICNVKIYGVNFDAEDSLKLIMDANEILGTNLSIFPKYITCDFDFLDAPVGLYSLIVWGEGGSDTLPSCFMVHAKIDTPCTWEAGLFDTAELSFVYQKLLVAGDGDNDGECEVYIPGFNGDLYEINNGNLEIIWNTGYHIFAVAVGDGDNDGSNEIYAISDVSYELCEISTNDSGLTWLGGTIFTLSSGTGYQLLVGDVDQDGNYELYAAYGSKVYKIFYTGSGWDALAIFNTGGAGVFGIAIGDADNDSLLELYAGCADYNLYRIEYDASFATWQVDTIANFGINVKKVEVGDGDNNGTQELYVATDSGYIYKVCYDGANWLCDKLGGDYNYYMADVCVADGDNDGEFEVLGAHRSGKLYIFKYDVGWITDTINTEEAYLSGVCASDADCDGFIETYGINTYGHIYKFKTQAQNPNIELSWRDYDFGNVACNSEYTCTLNVMNTGDADLIIENIYPQDLTSWITLNEILPETIPAGGNMNFSFTLYVQDTGVKSEVWTIESNDPDSPSINLNFYWYGLSGVIYRVSGQIDYIGQIVPQGLTVVAVPPGDTARPVAMQYFLNPSFPVNYELGCPPGEYRIIAVLDVDGDTAPSPGEVMGFYGAPYKMDTLQVYGDWTGVDFYMPESGFTVWVTNDNHDNDTVLVGYAFPGAPDICCGWNLGVGSGYIELPGVYYGKWFLVADAQHDTIPHWFERPPLDTQPDTVYFSPNGVDPELPIIIVNDIYAPLIDTVIIDPANWTKDSIFTIRWILYTPDLIGHAYYFLGNRPVDISDTAGSINPQNPVIKYTNSYPESIYVWLIDACGNAININNSNAFGVGYIKRDATPPYLWCNYKNESVERDNPVYVVVNASDEHSGLIMAEFRYREGGASSWHTIQLGEGEETLKVVDRITPMGLEFSLYAKDTVGNESFLPDTDEFYSVPVELKGKGLTRIDQEGNPVPMHNGTKVTDYRIFSIPLWVWDNSPANILEPVLGRYDERKWRFGEYANNQPVYYPHTRNFEPGRGFFIIVREPDKYIYSGEGITIPTNEPHEFLAEHGWNLVGNPYLFPLPISAITDANNDPINVAYSYGENGWQIADEIMPWSGVAIWVEYSPIYFHPEHRATRKSKNLPWEYGKAVQIIARCEDAIDAINYAGFIEGASSGIDEYDFVEPPLMPEYVSLYFEHKNYTPDKYTTDFRPPVFVAKSDTGEIFDFVVSSNIKGGKVTLSFEGMDEIGTGVYLVDKRLGATFDMKIEKDYSFVTSGEDEFALILGSEQFVERHAPPLRPSKDKFYIAPNPVLRAISVRYDITRPARVKIRVYDVAGRQVANLLDKEVRAGYHSITWDMSNGRLGSGIYFVRIDVNNKQYVCKLVKVK